MIEWSHAEVEAAGLLEPAPPYSDGPALPEGARPHMRGCPLCQSGLLANGLLQRAARLLAPGLHTPVPSRPAPDIAQLWAMASHRRPWSPELLTAGLRPFAEPARNIREAAASMELQDQRIRVRDDGAQQLTVLLVEGRSRVSVLLETSAQQPGLKVELQRPAIVEESLLIAILTAVPLPRELLPSFAMDISRHGQPPSGPWTSRMHILSRRLLPPVEVAPLRLREDALPAASPEPRALLSAAAAAGRADDLAQAIHCYRQAELLAEALRDVAGRIRARQGVARCLAGLGHPQEADALLEGLVVDEELDAATARWVTRQLAWQALHRRDLALAAAWTTRLHSVPGELQPFDRMLIASLALAQEEPAEAERVLEPLRQAEGGDAGAVGLLLAHAAAMRGQAERAQNLLDELPLPPPTQTELRLLRQVVALQLSRREADWERALVAIDLALQDAGQDRVAAWNTAHILGLVERALGEGRRTVAAELLGLRFLSLGRLRAQREQLLAVVRSAEGLLALGPRPEDGIRVLGWKPSELVSELRELSDRLAAGQPQERERLVDLLFPTGLGETRLLVGSDGLLAAAPMMWLGAQARGRGEALAPVVQLGSRRAREDRVRQSELICSFADAQGDLPSSREEVPADRVAQSWRGAAVTRSALLHPPTAGLLHIALHGMRIGGMTALAAADGTLSAAELSAVRMPGRPLVLLSGCTMGGAIADRGEELSLAEACWTAGASGVIATLWAVDDSDFARCVRPVVEAWPFHDPAAVVARAAEEARASGLGPDCWAAWTVIQTIGAGT